MGPLLKHGAFALSVLAAEQGALAQTFASKGGCDKFNHVAYQLSAPARLPVLRGVMQSTERHCIAPVQLEEQLLKPSIQPSATSTWPALELLKSPGVSVLEDGSMLIPIERSVSKAEKSHERSVRVNLVAACKLQTPSAAFDFHGFDEIGTAREHVALTIGQIDDGTPVLVRVHSECLTGDALFSQRCDCGTQLEAAGAGHRGKRALSTALPSPGRPWHRPPQ